GIAEPDLAKLFQPFSQVESSNTRRYGGTGLGLVISNRLSNLMGGRVWAESQVGVGSTFHFTIIAERVPGQAGERPAERLLDERLSLLRDRRILIVDGNTTSRMILGKYAQEWGMKPVLAATPEDALRAAGGDSGFHAMLIDSHLPNDGSDD